MDVYLNVATVSDLMYWGLTGSNIAGVDTIFAIIAIGEIIESFFAFYPLMIFRLIFPKLLADPTLMLSPSDAQNQSKT
ncbi:hypothetical protein V6N13_137758 [Hibiscus sabdariffa]